MNSFAILWENINEICTVLSQKAGYSCDPLNEGYITTCKPVIFYLDKASLSNTKEMSPSTMEIWKNGS